MSTAKRETYNYQVVKHIQFWIGLFQHDCAILQELESRVIPFTGIWVGMAGTFLDPSVLYYLFLVPTPSLVTVFASIFNIRILRQTPPPHYFFLFWTSLGLEYRGATWYIELIKLHYYYQS